MKLKEWLNPPSSHYTSGEILKWLWRAWRGNSVWWWKSTVCA